MRRGLITGTVLSLIVAGAWSVSAAATMGPAPHLHLSVHHPAASYLALASAPTGNGWALFAVLSVIYMLALLVAGWRQAHREGRRRR
jgi:hypothetical protein